MRSFTLMREYSIGKRLVEGYLFDDVADYSQKGIITPA